MPSTVCILPRVQRARTFTLLLLSCTTSRSRTGALQNCHVHKKAGGRTADHVTRRLRVRKGGRGAHASGPDCHLSCHSPRTQYQLLAPSGENTAIREVQWTPCAAARREPHASKEIPTMVGCP